MAASFPFISLRLILASLFLVHGDGAELGTAVEAEPAGDAPRLLKPRVAIAHLVQFRPQDQTVLGTAQNAHPAALAPRGIDAYVIRCFRVHAPAGSSLE